LFEAVKVKKLLQYYEKLVSDFNYSKKLSYLFFVIAKNYQKNAHKRHLLASIQSFSQCAGKTLKTTLERLKMLIFVFQDIYKRRILTRL
jgi:hypothetical protein